MMLYVCYAKRNTVTVTRKKETLFLLFAKDHKKKNNVSKESRWESDNIVKIYSRSRDKCNVKASKKCHDCWVRYLKRDPRFVVRRGFKCFRETLFSCNL